MVPGAAYLIRFGRFDPPLSIPNYKRRATRRGRKSGFFGKAVQKQHASRWQNFSQVASFRTLCPVEVRFLNTTRIRVETVLPGIPTGWVVHRPLLPCREIDEEPLRRHCGRRFVVCELLADVPFIARV